MGSFGLNTDSIRQTLREVRANIEAGHLDQAKIKLQVLAFWRLQQVGGDRTEGAFLRFRDSAGLAGFDAFQVNETADQISDCQVALDNDDKGYALQTIKKAIECWEQTHRAD